jgi:hypothetical protein
MKNFRMPVYNEGEMEIGYEEMEAKNLGDFMDALFTKAKADYGFADFLNAGHASKFY